MVFQADLDHHEDEYLSEGAHSPTTTSRAPQHYTPSIRQGNQAVAQQEATTPRGPIRQRLETERPEETRTEQRHTSKQKETTHEDTHTGTKTNNRTRNLPKDEEAQPQ